MTASTPESQISGGWHALKDGHIVYTHTWAPPAGIPTRAIITFIHGLGEHIDRYDHLFSAFAAAGFKTSAWDQRGFGRTAVRNGKQGDTGGWPMTLADVLEMATAHHEDGLKHFLMGHSMGGLISLDAVRTLKFPFPLAGLISSAPAISVDPSARPAAPVVALLRMALWVTPSLVISNAVDARLTSHDPAEVRKYQTDPLIHSYISLAAAAGLLDHGVAFETDQSFAAAMPKQIPILLVHGEADKVTLAHGTRAFAERVAASGHKNVTCKIYSGIFHELHNEPDIVATLTNDYLDWLTQWL
ncbi:Alpha/Beta hydrolase protein [Blastocladiella britannica]|nr:Alpha/Beta hydrolase protein [Blastocladiella britannica]